MSKEVKKLIVDNTRLKSRQLSVRSSIVGYDSKVSIVVKDERFPLSVIESLVSKYQHVERCEASGEVLHGGNTYVDVTYQWDNDLSEEFIQEITPVIQSALEIKFADDTPQYDISRFKNQKSSELLSEYLTTNDGLKYTIVDAQCILRKGNFNFN